MSVITNAPVLSGTFTSNGVSQAIALQPQITKFEVYDLTNLNASVANVASVLLSASWVAGMSAGFAMLESSTAGAFFPSIGSVVQSGGFSLFNTVSPQTFPAQALAAVGSIGNGASPAVVTSAAPHLLSTGDYVRIFGVSNLDVVNGLVFRVTVTGAATFTIPFDPTLTSSGGAQAAPGAGGFFRKIIPPVEWTPEARIITGISQAASAVVTTAVAHGYQLGAIVRLLVPANFGMTQANGLLATITAIPSVNSFTVNVDTSGFTAFAFPQQAPAFASSFAQSIPVGELSSTFASSEQNLATTGILLGANVVGTAGDLMRWIAYSGVSL